MATVTKSDIASVFLKELGAPDTPIMRRAVIAWLNKEGGTVIGNNPWNMRPGLAAESGVPFTVRTSTQGNGQFAVFKTPQDGAKAAARGLLHAGSDWRHYDAIVAGARSGSPLKFFQGLVASAWSGTRYGHNTNSLVSIYNGLGGQDLGLITVNPGGASTSTGGGTSGTGSATTAGDGKLCAWATGTQPGICIPIGHVLTTTDVTGIMDYLTINGFFAGDDPMGTAKQVTAAILRTLVGKPWNADMIASIAQQSGIASTSATISPPDVAGALGGIGAILGKAIGFAGGMVLVILGVFLYSKSVRTRVVQETPA